MMVFAFLILFIFNPQLKQKGGIQDRHVYHIVLSIQSQKDHPLFVEGFIIYGFGVQLKLYIKYIGLAIIGDVDDFGKTKGKLLRYVIQDLKGIDSKLL